MWGQGKGLPGCGAGGNRLCGACLPRRGMLKSRGSGVGRDFQRRSLAETVRGPAWALTCQALGIMMDRSKSEGGVRKGGAGRAVWPERS